MALGMGGGFWGKAYFSGAPLSGVFLPLLIPSVSSRTEAVVLKVPGKWRAAPSPSVHPRSAAQPLLAPSSTGWHPALRLLPGCTHLNG